MSVRYSFLCRSNIGLQYRLNIRSATRLHIGPSSVFYIGPRLDRDWTEIGSVESRQNDIQPLLDRDQYWQKYIVPLLDRDQYRQKHIRLDHFVWTSVWLIVTRPVWVGLSSARNIVVWHVDPPGERGVSSRQCPYRAIGLVRCKRKTGVIPGDMCLFC